MKHYELIRINEFTHKLTIYGENAYFLYKTIKKIIPSIHYDSEFNCIFFSGEHVSSFKEYLLKHKTYKQVIKIIYDLSKQINILKELGYGFYGFDISDILTIDNTFIFCSTQYLLPLINHNIVFYAPITYPYFSNPEIYNLTTLPSEINHKCVYYSLGVFVVFYLFNNYLLVGNEIKSQEEIEHILVPIYNTKIYWFLKRCLTENVDERIMLLI